MWGWCQPSQLQEGLLLEVVPSPVDTMGVAPIKILGKVWRDGKFHATLGGIRGGHVLNTYDMILSIGILFGIYLSYMVFSFDNTEVSMYIRTSGKKVSIGVSQEKKSNGFSDTISVEFSLFILFLTFTFTKYRT
jgi:hypothetical protein